MSFSRPIVEPAGDLVALGLSERLHRSVLLNVLSDEAIGVFISAALPGVIRSGEVDGDPGDLLDLPVAVELGSVVSGDGLEEVRVVADELEEAAVKGGNGALS